MASFGVSVLVVVVAVLVAWFLQDRLSRGKSTFSRVINLTVFKKSETGPQDKTIVWTITPNSTGLRVDAAIFKEFLDSQTTMLEEAPPTKVLQESHNKAKTTKSCWFLFLEVVPNSETAKIHQGWKDLASFKSKASSCRIMAMANTDQFSSTVLDLPNLELILCKTNQCSTWIQKEQKSKGSHIPIVNTGFTSFDPSRTLYEDEESADEHRTELSRFGRFLHVAGQSPHKGTTNIIQAWLLHPHWPAITITSYNNQLVDIILKQIAMQRGTAEFPPNIHHIREKLPRQNITELIASHGIHFCLSGMEGFGHYINEARAVGALTVTSNYPAMNELITDTTGILVEPSNMLKWHNGLPFANVAPPDIAHVMDNVLLPMKLEERAALGQRARQAYLADQKRFRVQMEGLKCYMKECEQGLSIIKKHSCAEACGITLQ